MRLTAWARSVGAQPRVLLAAKTAFAASLAWFLAPLIPLANADYSYYAPLGAVVSMYPTLVRSARTGVQALVGLALGAGIAFLTLGLEVPRVVGIAIVVGVGVLLAGVRFLGEGRNWVPITGLFVLLIGGVNADDYSINYLVHMVLGVVVGVLVTVLIAPPLYLQRAEVQLNQLRDKVADHLRDLASALRAEPESERDWVADVTALEDTSVDVRGAVSQADESRRGNPRGRRTQGQSDENYRRLRALERSLFYVRDLTDVLGAFEPLGHHEDDQRRGGPAGNQQAAPEMQHELPAAIIAVADLVASPVESEDSPDQLGTAERALDDLSRALDRRADGRPSSVSVAVTAAVSLQRIVESARPFVANPDQKETP
ncbi:FUSC family protein [Glaciibacter sp. 2TAF33]|uniref:FUSC family protein n=1 Tax=Glaciibacter sp. 2TAF33 TaxID=3233015 RepID=UPI003F927CB9